jgi:hypothetical protein
MVPAKMKPWLVRLELYMLGMWSMVCDTDMDIIDLTKPLLRVEILMLDCTNKLDCFTITSEYKMV